MNPGGTNHIYDHDSEEDQCFEIPQRQYYRFSMAIVNNLLTVIGGWKTGQHTNKLLSLTTGYEWMEEFPPMPTRCYNTAAICNGKSLVVTGGKKRPNDSDRLSVVKILNNETKMWATASSLPCPYFCTLITICGDSIYLFGGMDLNESRFHYHNDSPPPVLSTPIPGSPTEDFIAN